jgi:hypothetical protein
MSEKVAPFNITILIISTKYRIGFSKVKFYAQTGILSIGMNNPLIKIKINEKNQATNIACFAVIMLGFNILVPYKIKGTN